MIGLISNNNEDEYRQTISYISRWCSENYLDLNVTKMKEMILDMRNKQNSKTPVTISNSSVAVVSSYEYLGVIIQDNLKWNEHVEAQTRKANKIMYNMSYNSVISSVVVYAFPCWYNACDKKKLGINHKIPR